jgi:hypothetical protein
MKFRNTKSTKPCLGCPFRRLNTNEKPNPGGSHPFVYLGQTRGPFWLPCHQDKEYKGKGSDVSTVSQCRGAAIFRSNCEVPYKLPDQLLSLPKDEESVFSSEAEFSAHYLGGKASEHKQLLTKEYLDEMMHNEINSPSKDKRTY